MLVVVFFVCYSEIDFDFLTFFCVFVFGSIGVQLRVFGLLDARKILKAFLLVVIVFLFFL